MCNNSIYLSKLNANHDKILFLHSLMSTAIPQSYDEAVNYLHAAKWKNDISEDLKSIKEKGT